MSLPGRSWREGADGIVAGSAAAAAAAGSIEAVEVGIRSRAAAAVVAGSRTEASEKSVLTANWIYAQVRGNSLLVAISLLGWRMRTVVVLSRISHFEGVCECFTRK